MAFKVILSNKGHPEYGAATIPLPIPDDQYDSTIELLNGLGIGDAAAQDCRVDETLFSVPILNRLTGQTVNVDELDYLAKRLDSFDDDEVVQFQAMASTLCLSDIKDLINLTFCCQQATVITDFSDLEQIGKNHRLTLNGGTTPKEEYQTLDGTQEALNLIQSGAGVVTPYGVVYDNGMKLEQVYDGRHLPEYYYGDCVVSLALTGIGQPASREMLYLPCADSKILRAVQRLGAQKPYQCRAEVEMFGEVCDALWCLFMEEFELNEHLYALNRLARCYEGFQDGDMEKFHIVFDTAWPKTPEEAAYLVENLQDFVAIESIGTAQEYGQYIAEEMRMDAEVLESLDFRRLGQRRIDAEGGVFGDKGYVAYKGSQPEIQEIMARHIPSGQEPQMGGMA